MLYCNKSCEMNARVADRKEDHGFTAFVVGFLMGAGTMLFAWLTAPGS